LLPPDVRLDLSSKRPVARQGSPALDAATVQRVRAEFNEMRGFSPTPGQAARLFGLSREDCERVLASLAVDGFLHHDPDGRYRLG
jgi:hypothetical protein